MVHFIEQFSLSSEGSNLLQVICICFGAALICYTICLIKNLCHSVILVEVKQNPIMACSHTFSHDLHQLHVPEFALLSFDQYMKVC